MTVQYFVNYNLKKGLVPRFSFLDEGWLHIIFNMWWLRNFGDNIENYLGHFKYLVFYLVSGFAAASVHIALNLTGRVPTVGPVELLQRLWERT